MRACVRACGARARELTARQIRFIDIALLERCNRVKQLTTDRDTLLAGARCRRPCGAVRVRSRSGWRALVRVQPWPPARS